MSHGARRLLAPFGYILSVRRFLSQANQRPEGRREVMSFEGQSTVAPQVSIEHLTTRHPIQEERYEQEEFRDKSRFKLGDHPWQWQGRRRENAIRGTQGHPA